MSDKQGAPTLPPLTGGGENNGGSNGGAPQQTVSLQQVFANVMSTGNVQQFVLTSPGIAQQVLPSSGTTSQPIGVTRIVNLAGTSPRISVVNVAGSTTSPSRQNQKLVLTTSPKLVRTSIANMLVTPASQTSVQSSPPAKKKSRLSETGTDKTTEAADPMGYRRRIIEHKLKKMHALRDKYNEDISEFFFLRNNGSLLDYHTWRKRPPLPQYLQFMKQQRLETDTDEEEFQQFCKSETTKSVTSAVSSSTTTTTSTTSTSTSVTATVTQSTEVAVSGGTPVAVSTTLPPAVAQLSQQGGTPVVLDSSKSSSVSISNSGIEKAPASNPSDKPVTPMISSTQPVVKLVKLPASTIASSCDNGISNQEQIVEKAKQEAYVMQRISELQREGLWSEKRLPKIQEPPRPKCHWDYLLEEMLWLSTDFAQERKWKKAAAKKCARMVQKYFQEKAIQAQKAEKLEELRLKKIASFVAKEIKTFWSNVEKLVEYKQQTRLEEKRKKALDQHLNFIVDQTEKYSSWLTEGLNKTEGNLSTPASIHSSRISSPITTEKHSDDDFKPNQESEDDDEETIAKAEEEIRANHKEEVELLKKESELPLEDFLKELPPNYLEERDKSLPPSPKEIVEEEESDNVDAKDAEYMVASDQSSDDEEDTIQEQEKLEKNVDHEQELDDLKAENEMSIDELVSKYGNIPETPMIVDASDDESSKDENEDGSEEQEESESETENETESEDETQDDSQTQSDDEPTVGLKSLLEDLSDENKTTTDDKQNEMDSVAALAESIQPKGNTLLTTSVVTKIPFLLKHNLREYQHIGLDWLVTMFERKLNGILADEMGLGKTIQTIALLAHLACEKGNWGPHLIVVPTSVMLNWEMECKKWCPGFKILTYYGSQKERKQKRTGWTKPNAFHICITSYKLVIQDHQSFRRKKWKYLILDEAQNIKNFKSQRWQLLLNFQTQRRLLLTGTPLQNNLMELWSLMHFLMPNVFQSHREFKEWFSNPVTGMIEGNSEYNENIIRRLHKVLRPFLLRRLKSEVEKQLPKKYEHIVMCRLSKRQRYLYDDFMSRAKTKETLACGNLLSVMNVLMQLRKVCNHPNLFEVRPTVSPFQMEGIEYHTASLAWSALDYDPFKHIDLSCLNLLLVDMEFLFTAFVAHRIRKLKTPRKLIEEIDSQPDLPPRCPPGKIKINVRLSNQVSKANLTTQQNSQHIKIKSFSGLLPSSKVGTSPLIRAANSQTTTGQGVTLKVAGGQQLQGFSVQLVPHQGGVKAIPVGTVPQNIQSTATVTPTTTAITVKHGDSVQKYQVPSFAQLVQTSTGRHIILTNPNQQNTNALSFPVVTSTGQKLTVLSKQIMGLSTTPVSVNKVIGGVVTSTSGRPVLRIPAVNASQSSGQAQPQSHIRCGIVTRNVQKDVERNQAKETPKSEFYLPQLEDARQQRRQAKLATLADLNDRKCTAYPMFGEDFIATVKVKKPATDCIWHSGWVHCSCINESVRTRRQFFSRTEALARAIQSTEQIVEKLKPVFDRFVVYVPPARAPLPRFHVSHPPPHKLWQEHRLQAELQQQLSSKLALFHPVTRSMLTQFPDPRLIQYDCGKLQSMDLLLRQLKSENHRVLIFTQMTRMLDVLEAFLNYHGYIYLRLDGTTRVDQRQVLMERFNNNKRIFCFILSTRSGGVGVNLTGADTVVFYDSDWNPTMDAQAQDRCHRIGQTRDVHIYRLISERTIEENILKKANQKRLLGDLAIEGGNFTTAYFKSSTIQDLFNVDQTETDASARMADILDQSKDREKNLSKDMTQPEEKTAIGALESALAAVEEDQDVQAAKTAKAEAVADLAEFDENIPVDDADNEELVSKAEQDLQNVVSQLTPVERYAMRFVEDSDGNFSAAQLAAAERELEEQKKEWELDRLRAMRDEEERQMRLTDDDENPITFSREDAQNQVNNNSSNSRRGLNRKPARPVSKRNHRGCQASSGRRIGTQQQQQQQEQQRVSNRRSIRIKNEEEEQITTSSASDSETTSLSETDSQADDVAQNSSNEEQRNTSRAGSDDEEYDGEKEDEEETEDGQDRKENKILKKTKKNHFDLNSPRTRSRGNVKINLWTLDVSPILPESKPRHRSQKHRRDLSTEKLMDTDDKINKTPEVSLNDSPIKSTDISLSTTVSMNTTADDSTNMETEFESSEIIPVEEKIRRSSTRATRSFEPENTSVRSSSEELETTDTDMKVISRETLSSHKESGSPRIDSTSKISDTENTDSISKITAQLIQSKENVLHRKPGRPRLNRSSETESTRKDSLESSSEESKLIESSTKTGTRETSIKENVPHRGPGRPKLNRLSETEDLKSAKPGESKLIEETEKAQETPAKESIPHRGPGRPRKQSLPISPSVPTPESTSVSSYSTRSKWSHNTRSPHEERIATTSNMVHEKEPEICDTSDALNIPNKKHEHVESSGSASNQNPLTRPNEIDEMKDKTTVRINREESKVSMQDSRLSSKSDFTKENRSESPIISTRKSKVTRSSSRIHSELGNKEVRAATSNIIETEQSKSINSEDDQESTSMEVDIPPLMKHADKNYISSKVSKMNSNPTPKQSKITRWTTRSNVLEKNLTKKEETENVEYPEKEIMLLDRAANLDISTNVTASYKEDKAKTEQIKIKFTRSIKRSTADAEYEETRRFSDKTLEHRIEKSAKVNIVDIDTKKLTSSCEQISLMEEETNAPESIATYGNEISNNIESSSISFSKQENTDEIVEKEIHSEVETLALEASSAEKSLRSSVPPPGVTTRRSKAHAEITLQTSDVDDESKMNAKCIESESERSNDTSNVISGTRVETPRNQTDTTSSEQMQISKSNMHPPSPISRRPALRRRPDTPMPTFYSVRPTTRSLTNANNSGYGSDESISTHNQNQLKLSPRSPRSTTDNGFLVPSPPTIGVRRSRSTTYVRMSERMAVERKDTGMVLDQSPTKDTVTKFNILGMNRLIKRRPDTPMPSLELISSATRPNIPTPFPKSLPPVPKLKLIPKSVGMPPPSVEAPKTNQAKLQRPQTTISTAAVRSTDSNGNSLEANLDSSSNDKPQRTAKVVAILSLDTKQGGRTQTSSHLASPQKNKFNSGNSTLNYTKSPRSSKTAHSSKTSGIITSKTNNTSATDSEIEMVDLDDEPESNEVANRAKRVKRSRSSLVSGNKTSPGKEIQTIELGDDEEGKLPLKKSNRCNPPLHNTSPPDKMNNPHPET